MNKSIHQDVYSGIVLLLITAIFYWQTFDLPDRAALFPEFILYVLMFFSVAIIVNGIRKTKKERDGEEVAQTDDEERVTLSKIKMPLLMLSILVVYLIVLDIVGFFVTTSLLIALVLYILKVRKPLTYILTIVGVGLFIYVLFVYFLNVNLPQGILF